MNYNAINAVIACSWEQSEALSYALATKSIDFVRQYEIHVCATFTRHFPPSREGEPLSGLWDHFDPLKLGYDALEYRDPNIEVRWSDGYASLVGDRACIERATEIIRHVCRDRLPMVIEWLSADHQDRPEWTVSKAALITRDAVVTASSAAIADRWRAEAAEVRTQTREIQYVSVCDAEAVGVYFDIYLAERMSRAECTGTYAVPLDVALRTAGVGYVEQSGDWLSNERCEYEPEVCSEIVMFAEDLVGALTIVRQTLAAAGCRIGCQLQYERDRDLFFETYTSSGWSQPRSASVVDDGRAYAGEAWSGGAQH
jgi:hypothetical protein